jgi:hypothetical protein
MALETSLVYKNIYFYRFLMNLIYAGSYKKRFAKIIEVIDRIAPKSILELCFGDIVIADYCKKREIFWEGIDINENFVKYAKQKGYNVHCQDVSGTNSFVKTDLCLISGSLYHFNPQQRIILFSKILSSATKVLISEPVINLSERKGFIGFIARRSANAGKGRESFRFNELSLKSALDELGSQYHFNYKTVGFIKKDLIVLIEKNGIN